MAVERRAHGKALPDLGENRLGHTVVDDLAVDSGLVLVVERPNLRIDLCQQAGPDLVRYERERGIGMLKGSPCLRSELRSDANSRSDDGERAAVGDRYDRRLDPDKRPAGGERLRRLHLSLAGERVLNLLQSRRAVHREELLTFWAEPSHTLCMQEPLDALVRPDLRQVCVEEPPLQVVVPTNVPQELGERLGWF